MTTPGGGGVHSAALQHWGAPLSHRQMEEEVGVFIFGIDLHIYVSALAVSVHYVCFNQLVASDNPVHDSNEAALCFLCESLRSQTIQHLQSLS